MIGTALEALAAGAGRVTVFVHRGWYGGSDALAAKDHRIAELESRLAVLEGMMYTRRRAADCLAREEGREHTSAAAHTR